jgi:hypothetical protein
MADREAESFGGLEADDELERGGLLDGEVRRIGLLVEDEFRQGVGLVPTRVIPG